MTATLSTRMHIPPLGPDDVEVEVDYEYNSRYQELLIHAAVAVVDKKQAPIWHLLSHRQHAVLEEECRRDYFDRMDQAVVENRKFRDG